MNCFWLLSKYWCTKALHSGAWLGSAEQLHNVVHYHRHMALYLHTAHQHQASSATRFSKHSLRALPCTAPSCKLLCLCSNYVCIENAHAEG